MMSRRCIRSAVVALTLSATIFTLSAASSQAATASGGSRGGTGIGHTGPSGQSGPSSPAGPSGPSQSSHGYLADSYGDIPRPPRHPRPPVVEIPVEVAMDRGQCTPRRFYDEYGDPHLVQRCQYRAPSWSDYADD